MRNKKWKAGLLGLITAAACILSGCASSASAKRDVIPPVDAAGVDTSEMMFAGWNTKSDGSGTWYQPGQKIAEGTFTSDMDLYAQWVKKYAEFGYTGSVQTFTAPADGYYKLEAWGASGQDRGSYKGGRGGYSVGTIKINKGDKLYVYVGNNDTQSLDGSANNQSWGFNGGGLHEPTYGASGGGATDFRTVSGNWNDSSSLNSRILVAGGGGGANLRGEGYGAGNGGAGGGLSGVAGQSVEHTNYDNGVFGYGSSTPGTQTHAGECYWHHAGNDGHPGDELQTTDILYRETQQHTAGFGFGSACQSGGGGGWYGGGSGNHGGAAGGSGYVGSGISGSTTDGTQTITEPSGQKATGHTGNGYARVTLVLVEN